MLSNSQYILLECCSLKDVCENYFTCSSLKESFENVDATTIMDFIKEVNFLLSFYRLLELCFYLAFLSFAFTIFYMLLHISLLLCLFPQHPT